MVKEWHKDITDHINHWANELEHCHWPQFVYHFTDINNAVGVIQREAVLSRTQAEKEGLVINENADRSVIAHTSPAHKKFARFYFAPLTPTQYRNEGIKPASQQEEAHCPIPIFFAYDAFAFLSADSTLFSNGNMASSHVIYGSKQKDFSRIPFDMVFHRRSFSVQEHPDMVFHRHAEALCPKEAPFALGLKWIGCRSNAEMVMLKALLGDKLTAKYEKIIRIADSSFFEKRHTFIEGVTLDNEKLFLTFNNYFCHTNSFNFELTVTKPNGNKSAIERELSCRKNYRLNLHQEFEHLDIEVVLDSICAFKGRVYNSELV